MKARIVTNQITTGSVAKDYIKAVEEQVPSSKTLLQPVGLDAHQVLDVFEDHNKPVPADPAPPVKKLVKVLTHDIQGMTGLLACGDGKEIGARLFTGCHVRLLGVPDRKFIVVDIFWDEEEVKIEEPGTGIGYRLPWDSVEFDERLRDTGWPYASSAGQEFADWITRGSHISIRGEDRRFTVLQLQWDREAIRVRDDEGQDYVIPLGLIGPWPIEEDE